MCLNILDASSAAIPSNHVSMQTTTFRGRPMAAAVLGLCKSDVTDFRLMWLLVFVVMVSWTDSILWQMGAHIPYRPFWTLFVLNLLPHSFGETEA